MFEGCPITYMSQLQGEITLSSTKSEYTSLSYTLQEVIPIMNLLKEFRKKGLSISNATPTMKCRVFEDNSGALKIATNHKYRPRTKHLNCKLHHFRDYVTRGEVLIKAVRTDWQLADYLTKAVNVEILQWLQKEVQRW